MRTQVSCLTKRICVGRIEVADVRADEVYEAVPEGSNVFAAHGITCSREELCGNKTAPDQLFLLVCVRFLSYVFHFLAYHFFPNDSNQLRIKKKLK